MYTRARNSDNQRATNINESLSRLYQKLNSEQLENVGNYHIVKQIGQGSFSTVFMAIHKLTKTKVVLKSGSKIDPNFIREIFFHKKAFHDNITKLYEIIVTESKVYLAIEYCPQGELFDYFLNKNCALDLKDIRKFFSQIVGAVYYIHSLNFSHRDLKLENILIDKNGNCKLTDFGFARDSTKNSLLKTICGTLVYMAPEILLMRENVHSHYNGVKIDIWALGVILYTLLYGLMPFEEEEEDLAKYQIINEEPNYDLVPKSALLDWDSHSSTNKSIPSTAIELCKCLLQKDPSHRPFSLEYVLKHPFLGSEGIQMLKYTNMKTEYFKNFGKRQFMTNEEKNLLKHLKRLGVDTKRIQECVINRKCDQLDAFWYLLLEKEMKREKIKLSLRLRADKDKLNAISGLIGSSKKLKHTLISKHSSNESLQKINNTNSKNALNSPLRLKKSKSKCSTDSSYYNNVDEKVLKKTNKDETGLEPQENSCHQNFLLSYENKKNTIREGDVISKKEDGKEIEGLLKDADSRHLEKIGLLKSSIKTEDNTTNSLDMSSFETGEGRNSRISNEVDPMDRSQLNCLRISPARSQVINDSMNNKSLNDNIKGRLHKPSESASKKNGTMSLIKKIIFWNHRAPSNNDSTSAEYNAHELSRYSIDDPRRNSGSTLESKRFSSPKIASVLQGNLLKKATNGDVNSRNTDRQDINSSSVKEVETLSMDDLNPTNNKVVNKNLNDLTVKILLSGEKKEENKITKKSSATSSTDLRNRNLNNSKNYSNSINRSNSTKRHRPGSMISTYSNVSQLSNLSQISLDETVLSMDGSSSLIISPSFNGNRSSSNTNNLTFAQVKYPRGKSLEGTRKASGGMISNGSYSPSNSEQSSRKSSFYDYNTGSLNTFQETSQSAFYGPESPKTFDVSQSSPKRGRNKKPEFNSFYSTRRKSPLGSPYSYRKSKKSINKLPKTNSNTNKLIIEEEESDVFDEEME